MSKLLRLFEENDHDDDNSAEVSFIESNEINKKRLRTKMVNENADDSICKVIKVDFKTGDAYIIDVNKRTVPYIRKWTTISYK